MEVEFLNPIPGYNGYYASSHGKIYSDKDGTTTELVYRSLKDGLACTIFKNGKRSSTLVQHLVARAWFPLLKNNHEICHLDGNIENNRPDNLRWERNGLRVIPGFNGYYASKDGKIFSVKVGEKMIEKKFYNAKDGYCTVGLTANSSTLQKRHRVHVIMAKTWLENPNNLPTVNHKDGNGRNNRIENLEWMSYSEQVKHANRTGLVKQNTTPVCQADKEGNLIAEYSSIREASKKTGISVSTISATCTGRYRMSGGFVWYHKKDFKGQKMRKFGNCKTVEQYSLEEEFIREFESVNDAAAHVGVHCATMADACRGVQKTCKGFIWKYAPVKEVVDPAEAYKSWGSPEEYPQYKISRDGRIFSSFLKKELKLKPRKNGYMRVGLINKDGVIAGTSVHRLVATVYIPNPENHPVVNHLDGNPSNNKVENLEWTTYAGNGQHAYDTGLNTNKSSVIKLNSDGEEIERYDSVKSAAEANDVSRTSISYALNGKTKTCKGCKWIYA